MIKKIIKEKTPYEMYFVTEAPKKKPWTKTVVAKPDKRLAKFDKNIHDSLDDFGMDDPENSDMDMDLVDDTDFDQNISDEELSDMENEVDSYSDEDLEDTGDDTEADTTTDTDVTTDNTETQDVAPQDESNTEEEDFDSNAEEGSGEDSEGTEQDTSAGERGNNTGATEANSDSGGDDNTSENINVTPDGADQGEENFDANATDTSGEAQDANPTDAAAATPATGQPVTDEAILKYALYRNMKNLYIAVQNYQTKLDEYTTTSYNFNLVIKSAKNKLADLELMMYEYMTVKFKDETYIGSMHYYHKCIATIRMIFNLIKANKVQNDESDMMAN